MKSHRKRSRNADTAVPLKKYRVNASSSVASSSSSSVVASPTEYHVHTKVYQELLEKIKKMDSSRLYSNIQMFGPKGTGKTHALLSLKDRLDDVFYVDLADGSETVEFDSKVILIDNAQLFTWETKCKGIRTKKIIAAFSPGANVMDGKKSLSKRCGDGKSVHFFWRPFTYDETEIFARTIGFKVASRTNFEKNEISESRLKMIFCKTNGNPRFISYYFEDNNLAYMLQELCGQYTSLMQQPEINKTEMCKSLVGLLKTGKCEHWSTPSLYGLAYSISSQGHKVWQISHSYYGLWAVEYLEGADLWGERWQHLEHITQLMLTTSDVTVLGQDSKLCLKKADETVIQNEIGQKPNIAALNDHVTLLVLASNHNVIDSILYDCRGDPKRVYFIQTSLSRYSNKKKGIQWLQGPVKKDSVDVSEGKSIIHHYTHFLSGNVQHFYIYATTNSSTSRNNSVYFLDLLKLCPDTSSNYSIEETDSESD